VIAVRPDLGEVGEGLVAAGQAGHAGALLGQHVGQHEAVDLVVVDGQHAQAGQALLEGAGGGRGRVRRARASQKCRLRRGAR
jgi:hypothetical protein